MNYSQLESTFNKLDETHQMRNWGNNKGTWNATVVAKLRVAEKHDGRQNITWLPYKIINLTKEMFASVLHKFVSAYPHGTNLYYDGSSNEITDEAFFFVLWDK